MDVEAVLQDAGCDVIGPVSTVPAALAEIASQKLDGAVIDINLDGVMIFPVADALHDVQVPYLVLSGHSRASLPPRFYHSPFLAKPYQAAELVRILSALVLEARAGLAASRPLSRKA